MIARFTIEIEVDEDCDASEEKFDQLLSALENVAAGKGYSVYDQEWSLDD